MRRLFCLLLAIAIGSAEAGMAQEDWPTELEIFEKGTPIGTEAIEALLESNSVIIELTGEAFGQGFVLDCRSTNPMVLFFNGAASIREHNSSCLIEKSRLCLQRTDMTLCVEPRVLPGGETPFIAVWEVRFEDGSVEQFSGTGSDPATRFVNVPVSAEKLLVATGEIDLGAIAFSLDELVPLSLSIARDNPLAIYFDSPVYGELEVGVQIVGWPDPLRLPGAGRKSEAGDAALARSSLEEFISQNAPKDDARTVYGEFSTTWINMQRGPCIRIRDIQVETLNAVQACVDTAAGTMAVLIITKKAFGDETIAQVDVDDFLSRSQKILDSIRIGPLTRP
ncbi:hypothetical protein [Roseovarius aestuariivivens]|uniref:hypothetical protein n=1 Tax=Roseovarius aestuariivivens TaxID=1888910 RepID=UPI001081DC63|nr:hypothetical protein [Roseovarius aestuariivivens]